MALSLWKFVVHSLGHHSPMEISTMKHSDDDTVSILGTNRKEESLDSAPAQSLPFCAEIDTDGMHCYALVQVAKFRPEGHQGHSREQ